MAKIVKRYKTLSADRGTIYYEIWASEKGYDIMYFGYIVVHKENQATAEENFELAKELLFSQPGRTFEEVDIRTKR